MTDDMEQCPFLNGSDPRCSQHFHLEQLDHAMRYCFDRYRACPTFLELRVERRVRQIAADNAARLIQVTIPRRDQKPAAAA